MQSAEHVADDSSADPIIVAELRLDDTKFAKNQAGGDGGFHLFVDDLPKASILERGVDFVGNAQTELADFAPSPRHRGAAAAARTASSAKSADQLFLLQDSQGGLHRRPARPHEAGNRAFQQNDAGFQSPRNDIGPQCSGDKLVALDALPHLSLPFTPETKRDHARPASLRPSFTVSQSARRRA